jgi:hypothetical protein
MRKLLIFGDSLVARLSAPFGGGHVECRWGATSEELTMEPDVFGLPFLLAEDAEGYQGVVISVGTNDPWPIETSRSYIAQLCAMVPPSIPIVLIEPPNKKRGCLDNIDGVGVSNIISLHDFLDKEDHFEDDGLHLNDSGARVLMQRIYSCCF